jgi:hypothetical protein
MRLHLSCAGAAALSLFATLAIAQPPPGGGGHVGKACAADFQRFCPDATPGRGGGQGKCLRAHASELSDGCKAAVQERMAARQAREQQSPPPTPPSAPQ